MTEQVHVITDAGEQTFTPPPPKGEHDDLMKEADATIKYLERFTTNPSLDADLRLAFNDVLNTVKSLKRTVESLAKTANDNHTKIVEMAQAQRLIGN